MRPVERGPDPHTGPWTSWTFAADHLAASMGWYCAYCEVRLDTGPHVEHKQPKTRHGHLEFEWSNWLLACTNCNSTKGDHDVLLDDALWPDRDNTMLAYAYGEGGVVSLNPTLPTALVPLAARLRDLVGLDRRPGHPNHRRTDRRRIAYEKAIRARDSIATDPENDALRALAVVVADSTGFFSTWMTVFAHDADMRERLIASFPVAPGCFVDGQPTSRVGGAC